MALSKQRLSVVVTGVAPHSLGAAVVPAILAQWPQVSVIGIDRTSNAALRALNRYHEVLVDLDVYNYSGGNQEFRGVTEAAIRGALDKFPSDGICCLIQSAGLYAYGRLIDLAASARCALLSVNVIARVELLHLILSINEARDIDNGEALTYIDVGSTHGLDALEHRSVYAPSKAFGIDLCTALDVGREVSRAIYFATGPIDTHMLHRNHWVDKIGGPESFIRALRNGPPDKYKTVFVAFNEEEFRNAKDEYDPDNVATIGHWQQYQRLREELARSTGIMTPSQCGSVLAEIAVRAAAYSSGVYLATANPQHKVTLQSMPFVELRRRVVFEKGAVTHDISQSA